MSNSIHHLRIHHGSGRVLECSIIHPQTPPWYLLFENEELGKIEFQGVDLFECLCDLRQWLRKSGYVLICNGARVDAWPSSMARDMAGGKKVYITQIGCPATFAELVPTFGDTDPERIGTVEEQASYHKRWWESLR